MQVNDWAPQVPLNVQRRRAAKAALEAQQRVITVQDIPERLCFNTAYGSDGGRLRGAYWAY